MAIFLEEETHFFVVNRLYDNECLWDFFLMIFCYLRQNIWDICCSEALNMFCKVIKEINADYNWCPFKNVKPI